MKNNRKGFVFIETIVVISILTISLMSLYTNYSRIMSNTKELNTFDTAEYNYKTYFLKKMYTGSLNNNCTTNYTFPDSRKICVLSKSQINNSSTLEKFDAYIIDYLRTKEFGTKATKIFLVEYKKEDINNEGEYLTYISSLTM